MGFLFYLHRRYPVFLQLTSVLLQYLYHLALSCAIRQLRTNRHVPELGVQHLFLCVRQPVLLFGRLITRQNIQKDQTHNQPYQRVLFSDLLAPQLIAVQPTLYVMYICHLLIFSLPSSSRFHSPLLILSFSFEALRLWRTISLCPLGGVFWRGDAKTRRQGADTPKGINAIRMALGLRLFLCDPQLRTPATRVPFYFIVTGHTALFDNIKRSNRVSVKVLFYRPF